MLADGEGKSVLAGSLVLSAVANS
jgi:hypothetical protein